MDAAKQIEVAGFLLSSERLGRLVKDEEILDLEKRWQPVNARVFAERLILCSSDEQARKLIRDDRIGASAFFEVLVTINSAVTRGEIPTSKVSKDGNLPFYFVCGPVIEFLDSVQRNYSDKYHA